MIKEDTLISLGFQRVDVSVEESGCDNPFYYYVLDIGNNVYDKLSLLSNANDEGDGFSVQFHDHECVEITDAADLESLIDILKKHGKDE